MTSLTPEQRAEACEAVARGICTALGYDPDGDIDEGSAYGKPTSFTAAWTAWDAEANAALDAAYPIIRRAVLAKVAAIMSSQLETEMRLHDAARAVKDTSEAIIRVYTSATLKITEEAIRALGDEP